MFFDNKKRALARRLLRRQAPEMGLQLENGARIAVIGGGPAGSFFSYFLLRLTQSIDLSVQVDIFEPRLFSEFGPAGCNHCGGIISESLVQILAMDGIHLPDTVVQRGIDAYVLHTDDGEVRIETPLHEKRIAAIYRGGGPRGLKSADWQGFDHYLLDLACKKGAHVERRLVSDVAWRDERPLLTCSDGESRSYDLVVVASGVNSRLLDRFEAMGTGFKRPEVTTAFISEFHYGRDTLSQTLGTAMHVFLLDIPKLEFAAIIPKATHATLCLLGEEIDGQLVERFLQSPQVRGCFPPGATVKTNSCHCFPRINVRGAAQPFADRLLFVGDSGVTRLYKDGVGAAYRTAKAAATAAVLGGISAKDFRRHFMPACTKINNDNRIGRLVFWANDHTRNIRLLRRAMLRMTADEQRSTTSPRRMSSVLWDIFTGSAPYKEILMRMMHPAFAASFGWSLVQNLIPFRRSGFEAK